MKSFNLPGYLLNECLHQGADTVIYRARKESDFSAVIVKTIKAEYPTLEEITHLRHEYKILQHLPPSLIFPVVKRLWVKFIYSSPTIVICVGELRQKYLELRDPELFSRVLQREAVDITALSTATTSKTTISSATLDLVAVTKAVAVISSEKVLDRLLLRLMQITMENVGASKGFLFLSKAHQLWLVVQGNIDQVWLLSGVSLATVSDLPLSLINYVERTKETVVLNNPISEELLAKDPYIQRVEPKSIFCWPLLHEKQLVGILDLENHLSGGAFTPGRLEVLQLLANQASIYLNQLGGLKL